MLFSSARGSRVTGVTRHAAYVVGLLSITLLWIGIASAFFLRSANEIQDARVLMTNHARLFEENILRSISEADKALLYLRRRLEERLVGPLDRDEYVMLAGSADITSEIIVQFAIIDANGIMRASSADSSGKPIDLSDREHYRMQVLSSRDQLFISKPMVGRASQKWSLQLSRRYVDKSGAFAGVVVASLDPAHFTNLYTSIDLGQRSSITLIGLDGIVRASGGSTAFGLGRDLSATPLFGQIRESPAGLLTEYPIDEEARLIAYRRVSGHPLAVVLSVSTEEINQGPRRELSKDVLIGVIVSLLILAASDWGARYQQNLRMTQLRLLRSRRRAIRRSTLLGLTLDNMSQGIMLVDSSDRIPIINRRAIELLDLPESVLKFRPTFGALVDLLVSRGEISLRDIPPGMSVVEYLTRKDAAGRFVTYERNRPNGTVLEIRTTGLESGGFVRTITDITRRKRAQEVISRLASEDPLTGLANRRQFQDHLADCQRDWLEKGGSEVEQAGFGVLYLDLDRFKLVNDTFGHPFGDQLLSAVAERIRKSVRGTDLVARLGGDEFAILMRPIRGRTEPTALAERLVKALTEPYQIESQLINISTSIGIAVAPWDGGDAELLMKSADIALYAAKAAGRQTYRFFDAGMTEEIRKRREIENDLRIALESGDQLSLYYQPLVSLHDGRITGFEALMRWKHPTKGPISPADFIPIAEESGLVLPLGRWALEAACKEAMTWPGELRVAVNVSSAQLMDDTLESGVIECLNSTGLAPRRLELEITETMLMQNNKVTIGTLNNLRAIGVRISMDDFGTGYSSLSYLNSFPLNKIKIDRSFVSDLEASTDRVVIIRSIIDIARTLGMTTTAEGVETNEQLAILTDLGCDEVQGYLISQPAPTSELPAIMARLMQPTVKAA